MKEIHEKVLPLYTLILITGIPLFLYSLIKIMPDAGIDRDLVMMIVGAFISAFNIVLNYLYGSSRGSKNKENILNQISQERKQNEIQYD